jgi:dihydrofolate reductase
MITLIAAIGERGEIGYKNELLWHIPLDLAHFKQYTLGKTVVMGRKTFDSIGKRPLPGRRNIVITGGKYDTVEGLITTPSIESALMFEQECEELVIIGGSSIYAQTIDVADRLVITHVPGAYTADAYFPIIGSDFWQRAKHTVLGDTGAIVIVYERVHETT